MCVELNLPIFKLPFGKKKIVCVNDFDERIIDLAMCYLFMPDMVEKGINGAVKSQAFYKWVKAHVEELRKNVWTSGMSKYYELQFAFGSKADGNIRYSTNVYRGGHPNYSRQHYEKISKRLREFQIFNEDFRVFNNRWLGKVRNGFVYADPPYYVAEDAGYYSHPFTNTDHVDFAKSMQELSDDGFQVCISYDNNKNIYKLYKGWHIREIQLRYSLPKEGRPIKTELLIMNYKPNIKKQGRLDKWLTT